MDSQTAAIILCAGVGSRMGLAEDINKCAAPIGDTSSVRLMAETLIASGVDSIVIVTGYAEQSVRETLACLDGSQVRFVHNPLYSFHGCNYSLACGAAEGRLSGARRIIIAEGDSILHANSVSRLVNTRADAASLIRASSYVDFSRSVIAIGTGGAISRYAYNMTHIMAPPDMKGEERILGESMQMWSFAGNCLNQLEVLLSDYYEAANQSTTPKTDSGVFSINQLHAEIVPVESQFPDCWINLNTPADFIKVSDVEWLQK